MLCKWTSIEFDLVDYFSKQNNFLGVYPMFPMSNSVSVFFKY